MEEIKLIIAFITGNVVGVVGVVGVVLSSVMTYRKVDDLYKKMWFMECEIEALKVANSLYAKQNPQSLLRD